MIRKPKRFNSKLRNRNENSLRSVPKKKEQQFQNTCGGAVLMSLVMDGKAEAIKIVAREVGEKAFGVVRQKLVRPSQEGR